MKINTEFSKYKEKHLSNANSEKNLKKIITKDNNDDIRLSSNISKSTKNTLSIKIYLPGYHNKNKSIKKKKYQQSLNNINNPKDNIKIDINRSLDIKQKKFYIQFHLGLIHIKKAKKIELIKKIKILILI